MTDHGIARDQLRSIVERVERLHEERKAIADDIKEIYAEAKGSGFDVMTIKEVVKIRGKDQNELAEKNAILDLYLHALGMAPDPEMSSHVHVHVREADETTQHQPGPQAGDAAAFDAPPAEEAAADHLPEAAIATGGEDGHPVDARAGHAHDDNDPARGSEDRNTGGEHEVARGNSQDIDGAGAAAPANPTVVQFHPEETPAERSLRLRPHCQKPEACAGVGRQHCYPCKRAVTSLEPEPAA